MRKALLLLLAATAPTAALCAKQPEIISGTAKVVDGDSVDIGATRVRLFGIDAPEGRQRCMHDSKEWPCGAAAANTLRALIGNAPIDCEQRDVDRYGRVVAVCRKGATDLGAAMVSAGLALAYRQYSNDYVGDEDDARRAKRGMWVGDFTPPWDYRHSTPDDGSAHAASPLSQRQVEPDGRGSTTPNGTCRIKGNINSHGERIYHVPGTRGYDETVITESKGERWFCSEEEARAAGWRAPRG